MTAKIILFLSTLLSILFVFLFFKTSLHFDSIDRNILEMGGWLFLLAYSMLLSKICRKDLSLKKLLPYLNFVIILNALILGFFSGYAFRYLNQYNLRAPIQAINTQVIYKFVSYGRHNANPCSTCVKIPLSDYQQFVIDNGLYGMLNIGDKIIVYTQKGRFGLYVISGLKVVKNNYFLSL